MADEKKDGLRPNNGGSHFAPKPAELEPMKVETPSVKEETTKAKKKWSTKKKVLVGLAIVFVIGLIGSCGNNSGKSTTTTDSASTSASTEKEETSASESKTEEQKVDKSTLESAINSYSNVDQSAYTAETYQSYSDALANAQTVFANEDATQTEVDAAKNNLSTTYANLKEAFNPDSYQWPAFTDVARNPDNYKGQKVAFTGKVLQVVEGTSETDLRIATDGGYDDVIFVGYDPSILGGTHVLEDDNVTIYGTCIGQYTYESALGSSISLPGIYADQVTIN